MCASLVCGGVEDLLDQPQLALSAHERRFQAGGAAFAASSRDDARHLPEALWLLLALQLVGARVLVDDGGFGGALRRLADEGRSGLRCRLNA